MSRVTQTIDRTIVLVDDDPAVAAAFRAMLESHGIDVTTWSSFESAKQHIEQHPPDVLITDVRLGAFNGLQLAIIVKARRPNARVLVISGFDDPVLRAEAHRVGAVFQLKPISGTDLVDFVEERDRESTP
jgi:two-component system response regulator RegA